MWTDYVPYNFHQGTISFNLLFDYLFSNGLYLTYVTSLV